MRGEFLFHLGRLCHLKPADVDELDIGDFANLTDSIDAWLKTETQMRG